MAESNAKMHLREYVRDDDVDLAISVMLESFIQSQKYSVARIVRKKFMHFISIREESTILLINLIDKLIREKLQFLAIMENNNNFNITVARDDFETAAKELNIHDLTDFYRSTSFTRNFQFDAEKKTIIKTL